MVGIYGGELPCFDHLWWRWDGVQSWHPLELCVVRHKFHVCSPCTPKVDASPDSK